MAKKKWYRNALNNDTKVYWSVVAEIFIRTLKNKIDKYMISVSKNVYIDKLDYIVNKCNIICLSLIRIKPVDVKPNNNINSSKEINDTDRKFEIGDIVRLSKYKNIFAKGYIPNWSEDLLWLKPSRILFPEHNLIMILKMKKLLERFTKKSVELKK